MLPEPSQQQKMKENEFKSPLKVPVMARDAAPDPSAGEGSIRAQCGGG